MKTRILFLGLGGLLLVAAIFLQWGKRSKEAAVVKSAHLRQGIPDILDGWSVRDELLGASEAVSASALKTLNLDEYVYRSYTKGTIRFTIYAAYWAPGRMPTRLVASHTPDRCWTENGMRCTDMKFKWAIKARDRPMLPAEWRRFVAPEGDISQVIYWHLVENELYDYGERFNAVPHPWLWWKDTLAQALQGSREQHFFRITTNITFEELRREEGFETALVGIGGLGLWAPGLGKKS